MKPDLMLVPMDGRDHQPEMFRKNQSGWMTPEILTKRQVCGLRIEHWGIVGGRCSLG